MARYRIELATPDDDADLRRILADTPMPGHISVSFRREPSYFAAAEVDGHFRQVVAGRDLDTGRLIGFGSRSIRRVFVNGRPTDVGYLSALRLLAEHRNLGLIARGYAHFRKLHADGRAAVYLTTIAEGNDRALELLTSGRAGLPAYHPAGRYHTLAIPPVRGAQVRHGGRPATLHDLPAIVAFLQAHGPTRQFFPCYEEADFFGSHGALVGLKPENLLLAWRAGNLVGMLGTWDQSGIRQAVVHSYRRPLGWFRPLYNIWAWLRGRPQLPRAGEVLRNRFAAVPVVENDDREVFATLLDAATAGKREYLLLGLHERDPLLAVARRYAAHEYVTRMFVVCWEDGDAFRKEMDARVPYLELGSL
jgi:hypothetical protein